MARPAKQATTEKTFQAISERDFHALLRAVKAHEADKDEAVGSLRNALAQAVEKKHLDKRAFAIYRALARLSDPKLEATLAHLDHYREIGKLDERAEQQRQMFDRKAELRDAVEGDALEIAEANGHGEPVPAKKRGRPRKGRALTEAEVKAAADRAEQLH